MSLLLLSLLLAVGPELDPLAGSTLTARDRALLPSGRHLGQIADVWYVDIVSQQQNIGGIAMFDRLELSDHGRSYTQLRFFLDDLEITDPARPGSPIAELPHEAWERLRFESLWSSTPGFRYELGALAQGAAARGVVGYGGEVGGPLLLPERFMDREPATAAGAPEDRRALTMDRTATLMGAAVGEPARTLLLVEGVQQAHHYPTLASATGAAVLDEAERVTVLSASVVELWGHPLRLLALWQQRDRSHDRAELRLPEPFTLESHGRAFLGHLSTELAPSGSSSLALRAGVGLREDAERLHAQSPVVTEIQEEWMWMGRAAPSERLRRGRLDGAAILTLGGSAEKAPVRLALTANAATLSSVVRYAGGRTGELYRDPSSPSEAAGVSMTLYDPPRMAEEWLRAVRAEAEVHGRVAGFELRVVGALDHAALGTPGHEALSFVSPALGLAASRALGEGEAFLLVRHEPDALTAEAAAFLDPARPSGSRYAWHDDGDGAPEAGEAGRLLARTGGRYHEAAAGLSRPSSSHFSLGFKSGTFGPFRAVVTGTGRFAHRRFTVRFQEEVADSYAPATVYDPVDSHPVTVYERELGTEGRELYVLSNSRRTDFWIGAEVQLLSARDTWWFLNLGAAGYWSFAGAPFGSFSDRDDAGIIDESAADPNARVNAYGRPDSDRSFAINLLCGVEPLAGLSAAVALRYRDGQPFTRLLVAEELAQGPTVVMAIPRGALRHTFHMTLDARLRYELAIADFGGAILVDGFNLLGSGTEILEDPRSDTFRKPLEMVAGRTLFVSLEIAWR